MFNEGTMPSWFQKFLYGEYTLEIKEGHRLTRIKNERFWWKQILSKLFGSFTGELELLKQTEK